MMDMVSSGVAMMVMVVVLLAAGAVFVGVRVMGARQTEGDHPGEQGYQLADRRDAA